MLYVLNLVMVLMYAGGEGTLGLVLDLMRKEIVIVTRIESTIGLVRETHEKSDRYHYYKSDHKNDKIEAQKIGKDKK